MNLCEKGLNLCIKPLFYLIISFWVIRPKEFEIQIKYIPLFIEETLILFVKAWWFKFSFTINLP